MVNENEICVARIMADGTLVELTLPSGKSRTMFAVFQTGQVNLVEQFILTENDKVLPLPATNNLIRHKAVLLPEKPEVYGTHADLITDIQMYLHRYIDLSDQFRAIAAHYALLTWVYDAFNEVPYLRFQGDLGSGKTRALRVLGSICNKPFFASGASTVSPIFHVLDTFRGTLVLDEADFRMSDEKSELIKILNNGHAKGFPVLRTTMTAKREYDPRAFHVFGPKIIAMRRSFDDHALESRFLTENMGQRSLRKDIPISLPAEQEREATALRNKLLQYRFDNLHYIHIDDSLVDSSLSPRMNQILVPLLSLIEDKGLQQELRKSVKSIERNLNSSRAVTAEGHLLEVVAALFKASPRPYIPVGDIARAFHEKYGTEYERPITSRYVGGILRERLHLPTYKSHGVYVLPRSEEGKVVELCRRFGVSSVSAPLVSATG